MRSFVQNPTVAEANPAADTSSTTTAVAEAPPPQQSVIVPSRSIYVDGEVDRSDIRTPYLSCVQAVGPKSVIFQQGQIVLGENALTDAPKPKEPTPRLRLLFCRVQKQFIQNLPYNAAPDAPRPQVFRSKKEVDAVGGITEWRGNTPPTYIPKAICLSLVRAPAGYDDAAFNIIDSDKTYAPAMLVFQKTSYPAAKTLFTDLSLSLKNNPTATFYDVFWVREQKGQNWVWVAKLQRVREEKPSDALVKRATALAGGTFEVVEDDE